MKTWILFLFMSVVSMNVLYAQKVEIELVKESVKYIDCTKGIVALNSPYSNKKIHKSMLYKFGVVQGGYRGGIEEFQVLLTNNTDTEITILENFKSNSTSFATDATAEIAGVMGPETYQIWTVKFNTKNLIGPQNRWIDLQTIGKHDNKAIVYRIYFTGSLQE